MDWTVDRFSDTNIATSKWIIIIIYEALIMVSQTGLCFSVPGDINDKRSLISELNVW